MLVCSLLLCSGKLAAGHYVQDVLIVGYQFVFLFISLEYGREICIRDVYILYRFGV